jgi:uncharacterized phage protein (TIGR01671 family)
MNNRTIKVRAWDIFYDKFIYSDVSGFWARVDGGKSAGRIVPLMISTGLTDKKGREIYEGVILQSCENEEVWRVDELVPAHRHSHVTNIGYCSGKKYHSRSASAAYDNMDDWMSWPEMYEVIGNVYENPEFLTPKNRR